MHVTGRGAVCRCRSAATPPALNQRSPTPRPGGGGLRAPTQNSFPVLRVAAGGSHALGLVAPRWRAWSSGLEGRRPLAAL